MAYGPNINVNSKSWLSHWTPVAFLHRHTFNLFPHYPQLPFALFILHLFIYLKSIYLTFDFFHIVHNHSHLTLVEFWTYCIASLCHWTASVGVGGGEEGVVDGGGEVFFWGLITVFSDSDSSIQGTLSALETNLDQVFAIKLSDLKSLAKSGP